MRTTVFDMGVKGPSRPRSTLGAGALQSLDLGPRPSSHMALTRSAGALQSVDLGPRSTSRRGLHQPRASSQGSGEPRLSSHRGAQMLELSTPTRTPEGLRATPRLTCCDDVHQTEMSYPGMPQEDKWAAWKEYSLRPRIREAFRHKIIVPPLDALVQQRVELMKALHH